MPKSTIFSGLHPSNYIFPHVFQAFWAERSHAKSNAKMSKTMRIKQSSPLTEALSKVGNRIADFVSPMSSKSEADFMRADATQNEFTQLNDNIEVAYDYLDGAKNGTEVYLAREALRHAQNAPMVPVDVRPKAIAAFNECIGAIQDIRNAVLEGNASTQEAPANENKVDTYLSELQKFGDMRNDVHDLQMQMLEAQYNDTKNLPKIVNAYNAAYDSFAAQEDILIDLQDSMGVEELQDEAIGEAVASQLEFARHYQDLTQGELSTVKQEWWNADTEVKIAEGNTAELLKEKRQLITEVRKLQVINRKISSAITNKHLVKNALENNVKAGYACNDRLDEIDQILSTGKQALTEVQVGLETEHAKLSAALSVQGLYIEALEQKMALVQPQEPVLEQTQAPESKAEPKTIAEVQLDDPEVEALYQSFTPSAEADASTQELVMTAIDDIAVIEDKEIRDWARNDLVTYAVGLEIGFNNRANDNVKTIENEPTPSSQDSAMPAVMGGGYIDSRIAAQKMH